MNDFVKIYPVGSCQTDPFDRCRPSSLLEFLQDAGTLHALRLGAGRQELEESLNGIWVLSRILVSLSGPIPGGSDVRVNTWHRGPAGALFYRDFELYAGDAPIGFAVSAWVVVDKDTRSLKRPSLLQKENAWQQKKALPVTALSKLKLPAQMEQAGTHTVRYSDLDLNGHVNNTRYADFVCNTLGVERLRAGFLRDMQINYLAECVPGDTISIFLAEGDGVFYVSGVRQDGKPCFEAMARLWREE